MNVLVDQLLRRVSMPDALRYFSPRELRAVRTEQIEWVVDGLIPRGALTLLAGRPKAGKSLLAIDLLASVALGQRFLGRETRQGAALYVPAEDSVPLVYGRVATRLGDALDAPLYTLPADGSLDQTVRIDDPLHFALFTVTVRDCNPELIVLDPFRELHDRPENEADAMAALLRPLRTFAHKSGLPILLIHHRNKYASDATVAVRGSSAITGSVDVTITLDVEGEGDLQIGQIVTALVESRYAPRERFAARLGEGLRWEAVATADLQRSTIVSQILDHLRAVGQPLTTPEIARQTDLPPRSVANELTRLAREGRVLRAGTGKRNDPYRYCGVDGA